MPEAYEAVDQERFLAEPEKRSHRSAFARDRARVLHSSALRRLAAKTQVAVPWESDFPRTRLSHSLECGQVGRELGASLGADPDLVETACLAHDLGHPPFGHNGETALAQAALDCGGFEGNAQSFRLLTRLEAKSVDTDGRSVGLNLTRAALDAATKYPWTNEVNSRKFGVYADDLEIFEWMRSGVEGRCIEAQIMDWADDVSYSVHDLEDAFFTGQVTSRELSDPVEINRVVVVALSSYEPTSSENALHEAYERLRALASWPDSFDGTHHSLARLKALTSDLIGRFCSAAEDATRAQYGSGALSRYSADLIVPQEQRNEVAILKAISAIYSMQTPEALQRYSEQRDVIAELVHRLRINPTYLDPAFQKAHSSASSDAARLRVIIDAVASLTDPGAMALLQRLRGHGA